MGLCRDCGLSSGDEATCIFCRVRTRWWTVCDDLPVPLRGWAISSIRIWTGILQEESEKFHESQRQREEAERTASPKSASLAAPANTPKKGSEPQGEVDRPDKSWIEAKKEKDVNKSPKGSPGVVDLSPLEEEEKASSGSKVVRENRKTSRKRSRSRRRRDRTRSRSNKRRRRSSSRRARTPKEDRGRDKEKKAKPSVRPPRTPSRSPPRNRGGPPPKEPPVPRSSGPPAPVARPSGRYWTGSFKAWREPQYWGTNKGRKKKENQYYGRR